MATKSRETISCHGICAFCGDVAMPPLGKHSIESSKQLDPDSILMCVYDLCEDCHKDHDNFMQMNLMQDGFNS